jgi:P4 family phage/plasmid primase-like protien
MIDNWIDGFNEDKPYGSNKNFSDGFGKGILLSALKNSVSAEEYREFLTERQVFTSPYENLLSYGEEGLATISFRKNKGRMYITYETGDREFGYLWNDTTKLYVPKTKDGIKTIIIYDILSELLPIVQKYKQETSEEKDEKLQEIVEAKLKKVIRLVNKMNSNAGQSSVCSIVFRKLEDKHILDYEKSFKTLKDPNNNWIPIKGGKLIHIITHEIRERTPTDFFTYELPRSFVRNTDTAIAYIIELMNGNIDRAENIIRYCGYTISESLALKTCAFALGIADCGKSTFFNIMRNAFGSMNIKSIATKVFTDTKEESCHNSEAMALKGGKVVVCSETKESLKLNQAFLKSCVGSDIIPLRDIYKKVEEFRVTNKIWFQTNHCPEFNNDPTFTKKLEFFKFEHVYEKTVENEAKKQFYETNDKFLDEFFSLILMGSQEFFSGNQSFCRDVQDYTRLILEDKDPASRFLEECCDFGVADYHYKLTDIYNDYSRYCMDNEFKFNKKDIGNALSKKNINDTSVKRIDCKNTRVFRGVRKHEEPEPVPVPVETISVQGTIEIVSS